MLEALLVIGAFAVFGLCMFVAAVALCRVLGVEEYEQMMMRRCRPVTPPAGALELYMSNGTAPSERTLALLLEADKGRES